jgi:hypothetical protein
VEKIKALSDRWLCWFCSFLVETPFWGFFFGTAKEEKQLREQ